MQDIEKRLNSGLRYRIQLYESLIADQRLRESFISVHKILMEAIFDDKKILIFGNGGSAADADHFAGELVCQFKKKRQSIAAISLTTSPAIMTAQSNDHGFYTVFARQVEALCHPGDVVIGLTTSDVRDTTQLPHSQNIRLAFMMAKEKGAKRIGLFSSKTKKLLEFVDVPIIVPHTETALIQEAHQSIIHILSEEIENSL